MCTASSPVTAGDVNDGRDRQVINATAEDAKAALAAFHHLTHQTQAVEVTGVTRHELPEKLADRA